MQKTLLRTFLLGMFAVVVVFGLATAASAPALKLIAGNVIVTTDGGFTPTTLPKHEFAPIRLHGYGKISTADGGPPPVLKQLILWFDRNGKVETRGLPVCPMSKLVATTPGQARRNCPEAIVGEGKGKAVVNFPEQAPIPASSPLTIFNAPPKHGNPTIYAHAYTTVGGPSTYVVQVEIQKVNDGRYGFKTVADIPKIVNGYGTPIYGRLAIGKTWEYRGQTLSYANARCPDGRLQAKARLSFADETQLEGTFLRPCKGKG